METNELLDLSQENDDQAVDIDIYGDVCSFDLGEEIEKLKTENRKLESHIQSLNEKINKLNGTIAELKETQNNLTVNISSLFVTAQAEIDRKNRMIEELRNQVDSYRINKFTRGGTYKRKDREKSPLEVNNPKKCKYEDSLTNNMLEINRQEPKRDDRHESKSKYVSDREIRVEEDGNPRYRSEHLNERFVEQSRSIHESRSGYSSDRYNDSDSMSKYCSDRHSNHEDDGYYSRSKLSYDRYHNENKEKRSYFRYDNEVRDSRDSEVQYYSDRYNNTTNRYVRERDESQGDKNYRNYNRNSRNTSEDRKFYDRGNHRYEDVHNKHSERRQVGHYVSTYGRNEQSKTSERSYTPPIRDVRDDCPKQLQVTLKYDDTKNAEQEGRRSVTPMPTEEDIEEPKTKPPKKRLKMLDEMEKKVKQNRLSQANNSFSEQTNATHIKPRQSFDTKPKHLLNRSRKDSDRCSVTSNKSNNSDKSDNGCQKGMHKKDSKQVTEKTLANRNSDLSKITEKSKVSPNKIKNVPRKVEIQKTKLKNIKTELTGEKNDALKPISEKSTKKEEKKCIKSPDEQNDNCINTNQSKCESVVKVQNRRSLEVLKLTTEDRKCPEPNQGKSENKKTDIKYSVEQNRECKDIKSKDIEVLQNKNIAIDLRKDSGKSDDQKSKNVVLNEEKRVEDIKYNKDCKSIGMDLTKYSEKSGNQKASENIATNEEKKLVGISETSDEQGKSKEPQIIKTTKCDNQESKTQNSEQKPVSCKGKLIENDGKLKEPTTDLSKEDKTKDVVLKCLPDNDKTKNENENCKLELTKRNETATAVTDNQNEKSKQEKKGKEIQQQNEKKDDKTKERHNEVTNISKDHQSKANCIKDKTDKSKEKVINSRQDINDKDENGKINIQEPINLSRHAAEETEHKVKMQDLIKKDQNDQSMIEIKIREEVKNYCEQQSSQFNKEQLTDKEASNNKTSLLKSNSKNYNVEDLKIQSKSNKEAVQQKQELEQKIKPRQRDIKPKRKNSISMERDDGNSKNKIKKLDESAPKQIKDISDCTFTIDKILEKTGSSTAALNMEMEAKQNIKKVEDLPIQETVKTESIGETKMCKGKSKLPFKKRVEKEINKKANVATGDKIEVSNNSKDEQKKDIIESEKSTTLENKTTYFNETRILKLSQQRSRVNEIKRKIKFSSTEVIIPNHDLSEKTNFQTTPTEIATEKDSKCTTSEVKTSVLETTKNENQDKITNECHVICDSSKNSNKEDLENKVEISKNSLAIVTKNKSYNEEEDKGQTCKTELPPTESSATSLKEDKRSIKTAISEDGSELSTTVSSPDSNTDSQEESSDDFFNSNKTVCKLIEINNIEQEKTRPAELSGSLSDSSTSDDTIVMCNSDEAKRIDQKFDSLINNYIENLTVEDIKSNPGRTFSTNANCSATKSNVFEAQAKKSDVIISKENVKAKTAQSKVKVLEVVTIVSTSDKVGQRKLPNAQNSALNISKCSTDTHKSVSNSSNYDSPRNEAGSSNAIKSTPKRRITPTPVKDDKPLCSFENILTKTCPPETFPTPTVAKSAESPLHLTNEGEIPILHLDENHINDLPTEININDKNILNLLDTMSISNIDCDIPKFKSFNDMLANPVASASGTSRNSLTFENIIEKVTPVPVKSGDVKMNNAASCTPSSHTNASPNFNSDKVTGSSVQPGKTPSTVPRRRRRCRLVIKD